ncbi:Golgi-associated plant pathogenesis-related protein 1-like [Ixodes scapularis]
MLTLNQDMLVFVQLPFFVLVGLIPGTVIAAPTNSVIDSPGSPLSSSGLEGPSAVSWSAFFADTAPPPLSSLPQYPSMGLQKEVPERRRASGHGSASVMLTLNQDMLVFVQLPFFVLVGLIPGTVIAAPTNSVIDSPGSPLSSSGLEGPSAVSWSAFFADTAPPPLSSLPQYPSMGLQKEVPERRRASGHGSASVMLTLNQDMLVFVQLPFFVLVGLIPGTVIAAPTNNVIDSPGSPLSSSGLEGPSAVSWSAFFADTAPQPLSSLPQYPSMGLQKEVPERRRASGHGSASVMLTLNQDMLVFVQLPFFVLVGLIPGTVIAAPTNNVIDSPGSPLSSAGLEGPSAVSWSAFFADTAPPPLSSLPQYPSMGLQKQVPERRRASGHGSASVMLTLNQDMLVFVQLPFFVLVGLIPGTVIAAPTNNVIDSPGSPLSSSGLEGPSAVSWSAFFADTAPPRLSSLPQYPSMGLQKEVPERRRASGHGSASVMLTLNQDMLVFVQLPFFVLVGLIPGTVIAAPTNSVIDSPGSPLSSSGLEGPSAVSWSAFFADTAPPPLSSLPQYPSMGLQKEVPERRRASGHGSASVMLTLNQDMLVFVQLPFFVLVGLIPGTVIAAPTNNVIDSPGSPLSSSGLEGPSAVSWSAFFADTAPPPLSSLPQYPSMGLQKEVPERRRASGHGSASVMLTLNQDMLVFVQLPFFVLVGLIPGTVIAAPTNSVIDSPGSPLSSSGLEGPSAVSWSAFFADTAPPPLSSLPQYPSMGLQKEVPERRRASGHGSASVMLTLNQDMLVFVQLPFFVLVGLIPGTVIAAPTNNVIDSPGSPLSSSGLEGPSAVSWSAFFADTAPPPLSSLPQYPSMGLQKEVPERRRASGHGSASVMLTLNQDMLVFVQLPFFVLVGLIPGTVIAAPTNSVIDSPGSPLSSSGLEGPSAVSWSAFFADTAPPPLSSLPQYPSMGLQKEVPERRRASGHGSASVMLTLNQDMLVFVQLPFFVLVGLIPGTVIAAPTNNVIDSPGSPLSSSGLEGPSAVSWSAFFADTAPPPLSSLPQYPSMGLQKEVPERRRASGHGSASVMLTLNQDMLVFVQLPFFVLVGLIPGTVIAAPTNNVIDSPGSPLSSSGLEGPSAVSWSAFFADTAPPPLSSLPQYPSMGLQKEVPERRRASGHGSASVMLTLNQDMLVFVQLPFFVLVGLIPGTVIAAPTNNVIDSPGSPLSSSGLEGPSAVSWSAFFADTAPPPLSSLPQYPSMGLQKEVPERRRASGHGSASVMLTLNQDMLVFVQLPFFVLVGLIPGTVIAAPTNNVIDSPGSPLSSSGLEGPSAVSWSAFFADTAPPPLSSLPQYPSMGLQKEVPERRRASGHGSASVMLTLNQDMLVFVQLPFFVLVGLIPGTVIAAPTNNVIDSPGSPLSSSGLEGPSAVSWSAFFADTAPPPLSSLPQYPSMGLQKEVPERRRASGHGSASVMLTLNQDMLVFVQLNAMAKAWATKLATEDRFEHSPGTDHGENIYVKWSSDTKHQITGREAVESWYSEISEYHWDGGEPDIDITGHFTQLIWKETTHLGCAQARGATHKILVVANYSPPGNVIGKFASCVPPLLR